MDTLSAVYTDSCYVTFAAKWCEQGQRVSVSGRAVRLMNGGTEMQNMIITCGREGAGARLTSFWAGNSPTIGPGTHTYTHRSVWHWMNTPTASKWSLWKQQILTGVHLSGQDVHGHLVSLRGFDCQPILQGHRRTGWCTEGGREHCCKRHH